MEAINKGFKSYPKSKVLEIVKSMERPANDSGDSVILHYMVPGGIKSEHMEFTSAAWDKMHEKIERELNFQFEYYKVPEDTEVVFWMTGRSGPLESREYKDKKEF